MSGGRGVYVVVTGELGGVSGRRVFVVDSREGCLRRGVYVVVSGEECLGV